MMVPLLSAGTVGQLLSWFEREGKVYPWGDNITSYRVWVSEIMLQQTVVTAVIPYFTRWMERFPTPLALAEAEEEEVLRHWEGLGYYSRGRNLLKAARIIRDRLGGELPGDLEGWKALPGVGDYTARAVLSIASGLPYPVLDANVRRIGQRLLGRRHWPAGADRELMEGLEGSIPRREPGKFNAALMQLGQLVCRTGTPLCSACPLRMECTAAAEGTAAEIPERRSRNQTVLRSRRFVISREGRVLMIRRDHGIGRGLWVLPGMDAAAVDGNTATLSLPSAEEGRKTEAAAAEETGEYGSVYPADDAGTEDGFAPAGGTDPRGFPRGTDEVFIQMVKKITPIELKSRRHTYTRYREDLTVEAVIWEAPGAETAAAVMAEPAASRPGAEAGAGVKAEAGAGAGLSVEEARAAFGDTAGPGTRRGNPAWGREALEQLAMLYADSGWEARWFSLEEIGRLPLPAVYRKIMDEVRG